MKKIKILLAALLTLSAAAFSARADVTNVLTFTVTGNVQQPTVTTIIASAGVTNQVSGFTNVVITTAMLLKNIASDQGITLPPGAKLGLINNQFEVLNANNTVFADVTVMTYSSGAAIGRYTTTQNRTTETSKSTTTQIATITYSGANLTFSLNIATVNTATSGDNYVNGKASNIIGGGYGFGYGTIGGAPMIAKGFLGGGGSGTYTVP